MTGTRAIILAILAVVIWNTGADRKPPADHYHLVAHLLSRDAFDRLDPLHRDMVLRIAADRGPRMPLAACFEEGPEPDWDLIHSLESVLANGPSFQPNYRWSATATNPSTGSAGDPITLRWSFMPDGTIITGGFGEPTSPSNLFATMNSLYGSPAVWQAHFASVFDKWSQLSGVTYVYEPNDDGAGTFNGLPGVIGVRGDVRIGGHTIDGQAGTNILAYNFYPNFGDMILDTSNTTFFGNPWNNALYLRNTVAHEHGHGLGLAHVCPTSSTKLMEPFISSYFDGPQQDDIQGAQKNYGDTFENNDTMPSATDLGLLQNGTVNLLNLSCDDGSDVDWYRFTVNGMKSVTLTMTPTGTTYLEGPEGGTCSTGTLYNALAVNDLGVALHDQGGVVLASSNANPAGAADAIQAFALPTSSGNYYVRVFAGAAANPQMYRLDVSITESATSVLVLGGTAGDRFGSSVANAGDVNGDAHDEVIVGAPHANPNGTNSGQATVYSGADGSVLYTFDGANAGDLFGTSVAGAGDVNGDGFADVIVGAPNADFGGIDAGRTYVYSGLDGSLIRVFDGGATNDQLGYSVAGVGDVDGDGRSEVIVGARYADPAGTNSGRARIYSGLNGAILQTFAGAAANDEFGTSVAGAGDVDGNGIKDVIVGAPLANPGGTDAGQAKVYSGQNGAVLFTFNGIAAGANLGMSVSGAGDVNGDGRADLIVGSPNAAPSGKATVYSGLNGAVLFTLSGGASGDQFGWSVSGAGDIDANGFADVIVGARWSDVGGSSSGSARVYLGPTGALAGTLPGNAANDEFGFAVGGGGDLGNDGYSDLIVGAPLADTGGPDAGVVLVYRLPLGSGASVGIGCGGGPTAPGLTTTVPVLGGNVTFSVMNAAPSTIGSLLGSTGTPTPSPLGGGCVAYVNLTSFAEIAAFTTDSSGIWTVSVPVPADPTLSGVDVVLQAVIFSTGGPLGIEITNGVSAQVGY